MSEAATYQELGRKLRDARLERRMELHDIAQVLHIRQHYLELLEDGVLEELPGDAFVKGYLGRYAWYLGLDSSVLVEQYQSIGTLPQRRLFYIPDSMRLEQHPGWNLVVATLALAAFLMTIWSGMHARDETVIRRLPRPSAFAVAPLPPVQNSRCLKPQEDIWPPCYYDEPAPVPGLLPKGPLHTIMELAP